MKKVITWTAAALMTAALTASALAADTSHTVACLLYTSPSPRD